MTKPDTRFEPIHDEFVPLQADKISQLETKLKFPFPEEYVAFLSQYGGCGFAGDANATFEGGELPIFTFFDQKHLLLRLLTYDDLTAEGKIAIADDMAGNPYVLDTKNGAVYFLNFTVNPPIGTKVAKSFEEFLASIEVTPFE